MVASVSTHTHAQMVGASEKDLSDNGYDSLQSDMGLLLGCFVVLAAFVR